MPALSFFVRITRPYCDLSGIVAQWAMRCDKLVVYEHIGGKTEKTHIHAAIFKARCDKKTLKNAYSHLRLSGNEDHSWKSWDEDLTPITYMTKGVLQPSYLMGFSRDEIDVLKAQWVEPKDYVKRTCWQKLYEDFAKVVSPKPEWRFDYEGYISSTVVDPAKFQREMYQSKVLKEVFAFVRNKNGNTWSPNYVNQVKCCFFSHMFHLNLQISSEWVKENMKIAC